jgi:hypothetical protein
MIVEQAVTNQVVDMGLLTQTAHHGLLRDRSALGAADLRKRRPKPHTTWHLDGVSRAQLLSVELYKR